MKGIHKKNEESFKRSPPRETIRKKSEQRYRDLQNKLVRSLERISDGFVSLDTAWRFQYINDTAAKIIGLPKEKLLDQKFCDIFPGSEESELCARLVESARNGEPVHFEIQVSFNTDGWLEVHGYPSPEGLSIYFRDITERKQSEELLRLSERRFRLVAEATGALVYDLDFKTGRLDLTHGVENIVDGLDIPEYPSFQWWVSLIHPDDLYRLFEEVKKSQRAGEQNGKYIYRVRNKEGGYRTVQDTVHVLWEGSEIVGHIGGVIDITERVQAEDVLRASEERAQLRAAEAEKHKLQVEEINRELESFSYSISHDLRAPLRAIDGFTAMLLREYGDGMDDEFRRKFNIIRENVRNMSNLIDDLLNLSRFGRQALNWQVLDMEKLFRETWNELCFSESLSEACELTVTGMSEASGDSTLVKQVVKNLLSNAIKYKKKDTPGRIDAGSALSGNSVAYYVRDNGIGFDMCFVDKLFGIFQRLHSSSEYEGTGVGLAIVKRIIQKHGGRVWAEGEQDKGACFYFTLPKNPASS